MVASHKSYTIVLVLNNLLQCCSELDVREADQEDDENVESLLSNNSDMCESIMPIFQDGYDPTNDTVKSFVLTTEEVVVGVAVIW